MQENNKYAKFVDISNKINPQYCKFGYVTDEMTNNFESKIENYVKNNNLKFGDILFVGSEYETRQHYGFKIVLKNGKLGDAENGYSLPFENNIQNQLKSENIKYSKLFEDIKKWPKVEELWMDSIFEDEVKDDFIKTNIW